MVLDTSALTAILFDEIDAETIARAIERSQTRRLSAANRVELSMVVEGRKGDAGRADLERLLAEAHIEIVALTPEQAEIACQAFRRFGRGRHRAGLNLGDCFAYALARATGEPLLYTGADFARTDIATAV